MKTLTEYQIPISIHEALLAIQKADPSAIVAGGCLRDAYIGVDHRDIDIYVGPGFNPVRLDGWGVATNATPEQVDKHREYYGEKIDQVMFAGKLSPASDWLDGFEFTSPVQVIQHEQPITPLGVLQGFDWGFCQVAFDGTSVIMTKAFQEDMANNTATFMLSPGDRRVAKSIERGQAFAERFPDRRFIFPKWWTMAWR